MTEPQAVEAAESLDPVVYLKDQKPLSTSDIGDVLTADSIEKVNAGTELFFMLYALPKEFWVGDGPGAQLLKRYGFDKAYMRAQRAFLGR